MKLCRVLILQSFDWASFLPVALELGHYFFATTERKQEGTAGEVV